MSPIRVAVAGVHGHMGRIAASALASSSEFAYAGGLARRAGPESDTFDSLAALLAERKPDVLLDLTTRPDSVEISTSALSHGVRPVVGASGWTAAETETLAHLAEERGLGAMIVPKFLDGGRAHAVFCARCSGLFPSGGNR